MLPNSKLVEELFSLSLDIFRNGRGRLPESKTFEELFCLRLDIFQAGVVYLNPKMMRKIFCSKFLGDKQSPNT